MKERHTALAQICHQFGVATLYVFGSRAQEVRDWLTGQRSRLASGPSDIDIGVAPKRGSLEKIQEKVRLAIALEDFFGCDRVDLVLLPEADPFLAVEVVRGERLYADNPYYTDEYDLYILRRAGDLIPMERERMALVLGEAE